MMDRFFAGALKYRILVCLVFAAIAIGGIVAFNQLPIDAFPDLVNNQAQIFAEAEGMGPEESEQLVTIPLESALLGLPNVKQVRSISKYGLSVVTVVFGDETPTYFARQLISERLQNIRSRLPDGVQLELGPVSTAMGEIFQYVLVGNQSMTAMDLKTINDWDVKYRLRMVPGVADVNGWGGQTKEFEVYVHPSKLLQYDLALQNVFDAIARNNSNFGAGILNQKEEQALIRGVGRIQSIEDIKDTVIANRAGVPVTVKDVAEVNISSPLRQGAVTKDGKGETVAGIVMMLKGENSRDIIQHVKESLKEIQASLPKGVQIEPFYDQTELVEQTVKTVETNLLEGGALVVAVLMLLLGNIRAAILVSLVIPMSLMFSFIGMRGLGISANIMSLGAIDFGMIVDGAIVMMENIVRRLSHRTAEDRLTNFELIQSCIAEMARPILFGVLIITIVYLPILSLQGMEYKMFSPMVFTVTFALAGSLLTALFLIPALSSFVFSKEVKEWESPLIKAMRAPYLKVLRLCMRHKVIVLVPAAIVFVLTAVSAAFLGSEFVPTLDEGDVVIQARMPTSISLPEAIRLCGITERTIAASPEVAQVESRIGRPELATDPMGIYQADVFVMLKPSNQWRRHLTKSQLVEEIRNRLATTVPATDFNFSQPIAMRVDELVSGVKAQVAVKLFGDDVNILQQKSAVIEQILKKIRGAADVQSEKLFGSFQLLVIPDRARLARYGVNVEQVRMLLESSVMGTPVSEVINGRRRFKIRMRTASGASTDIGHLLVESGDGRHIPLSQVASIESVRAMEVLNRESAQRRVIVQCNVRERDVGSFVHEAQEIVKKELKLPPGYFIAWGGQFENQQRAMQRLSIVVPASVGVIFALLAVMFSSARVGAIVLLNVPFALIGGVLALWIRGMYLSVPACIGFIALFGVAVLNGIVLVSAIETRASEMPLKEAIETAAMVRLRPVLMTAFVATLGFFPMAASCGAGAEVQKPLATVVIGGLVTSTLLTLLVLPVVYSLLAAKSPSEETKTS